MINSFLIKRIVICGFFLEEGVCDIRTTSSVVS